MKTVYPPTNIICGGYKLNKQSLAYTRGGQVIFEQTVGSISIEVDI